jgi:flagellin-specific chaperone FliS
MYNNPYLAYKKTASSALTMAQSIAVALEKAADHATNMVSAIQNNDVEQRVEESNKASIILNCLKDCIVRVNEEQAATANMFESYFTTFNSLILKASMREDLKSAQSIAHNLRDMAKFWSNLDQHLASVSTENTPPAQTSLDSISLGA